MPKKVAAIHILTYINQHSGCVYNSISSPNVTADNVTFLSRSYLARYPFTPHLSSQDWRSCSLFVSAILRALQYKYITLIHNSVNGSLFILQRRQNRRLKSKSGLWFDCPERLIAASLRLSVFVFFLLLSYKRDVAVPVPNTTGFGSALTANDCSGSTQFT